MPVPNLALLVVDAQPVFLNAMTQGDALGDACRFVAGVASALDIRVAFTEQRPDKLGGTRPDILAAAPGAPVFTKSAFSAFGEEGAAEWLRENDITHLLVAGLETPICVYQTVLGAMAEGLEVTLLTDATGGRRAGDHEATLRALDKKSECHLLPSEVVFYAIMGDASHAAFKAVSALVKSRGATGSAPESPSAKVAKPSPSRGKADSKAVKKAAAKSPVGKQRG